MLSEMKSPERNSDDKNKNYDVNYVAVKDAPKVEPEGLQKPRQPHKKTSKLAFKDLSPKKKALVIVGAILLVSLISALVWFFFFKGDAVAPSAPVVEKIEPAKTSEPSRLTGLEVPLDYNKRTATGIMIENSPDARPQSGLKDAGVIYEAVAEGGITRFMAVFQDNLPEYVGPVRSVRPYYLDFLGPYDAGIAHVGGSGQALAEIKAQGIKDLDQFSNTGPYWRESSRFAPHNMYTSVVKLKELEAQKGWTSTYTGFARGGEDKASATPNARGITIRMSSTNYNVAYEYDPASNTYKRSEGGRPHMDAKSNTQLTPKVLVVPVIARSQSGIYSVYAVNSSGKVYVFQNGTVTEGTWTKADRKSQFKFAAADGQPLKLAPGQTWVTVAAAASDVGVTP